MDNCYSIYIGNLSITVTRERLQNLFSKVGEISSIWINYNHKTVTYAFIAFDHLIDAKKACEQFNGQKLDEFIIKVNLSKKTEQKIKLKLKYSAKRPNGSVLLELPKKTGCSNKELAIRILRKDLIEHNEIVKDYAEAYLQAENIPFANKPEIIKSAPETPDLTTLETTIKRYFKPTCEKSTLKVDFDLSKGKVLTTEQYEKFFNLKTH